MKIELLKETIIAILTYMQGNIGKLEFIFQGYLLNNNVVNKKQLSAK